MEAPVIDDAQKKRDSDPLNDDNPMRGEIFGGKEMRRKRIRRW
jgi:hypothetical protein